MEEKVLEVLISCGGIAKMQHLTAAGIKKYEVIDLLRKGKLLRIRHGYYKLNSAQPVSDEQMLASLLSEGILCLDSALFHYGYSDFTPREWTIAVPRSFSRSKVKIPVVPVKFHYVPDDIYLLGRTVDTFNGVELAIYNRERTIIDCFRFRARMDHELFVKAIRGYINDDQRNIVRLAQYARQFGIFGKVFNLMEVLLND
jgi:predicted transcriptional regulator of viral defense system